MMVDPTSSIRVRLLALLAALPWPAYLADPCAAVGAPDSGPGARVVVGELASFATALPNERRPLSKADRDFLNDGACIAALVTDCVTFSRREWTGPVGQAAHTAANHPSCAFLCRFLI
jgi:hypothetical protein